MVGDAENLPFASNSFDLVYSWGVLHHTPDTEGAIAEVRRVLKPGGQARVMLYHLRSWVAFQAWLRYGLLSGRPWASARSIIARHVESPGTKAYSVAEARRLFAAFSDVSVHPRLTAYDLLEHTLRSSHLGRFSGALQRSYPRALIRALGDRFGWNLLIQASKGAA
jgi:SAM-dependent methyltransferase